jgi:diguanylate cyclase (GGDEF)-like protein/putative nucleotidyltransferase with HDIG domain
MGFPDADQPRGDRRRGSRIFSRIEQAIALASDEAVGWRSLGALFLVGGLLSLAALPLASSKGLHAAAVAVIALTAMITGFLLCRRAAGLPARLMSPALGFGTLLITLVVIAGGQPDGRYSLFYLWVAFQAFYFLTPRVAALHMVLAASGYAVALVVLRGGADQWLLLVGTVTTTGWLIGALRERIELLSVQARTDVLTGLTNRRSFDEQIEVALESARRCMQRLSLVVIDLDCLKVVNDRHGHLEGDSVLRRFAKLCADTVELPVARLGGDEFAIIASGLDQRAAAALAYRIHQAVRSDSELARREVTISIGIATFPAHADSSRSLCQAADRALYYAKRRGRDQVVAYGPKIEDSLTDDPHMPSQRSSHLDAVILLSETLDLRDFSTSAHSQTVARYAAMIAKELGLDGERKERIRLAGLVHDLGKIGVPDHVLLKPGPLTTVEWQQMQRHPEIGAQILDSASLPDLARWVLAHHERPDGTGYPLRLSGDAVSLEARILAVADAYEAMTSDRPYRAAMPAQAAREELLRHRATQFDAAAVDALLRSLDQTDSLSVEHHPSFPAVAHI